MFLTVFTPTYNRAITLTRLFESLVNQPFRDFEWLIVDDGSMDNTEDVVKSFNSNSIFPIRYIKKNNGGKHTAYNIALNEAKGDFFFVVDSDDWLPKCSLSDIAYLADKIFSDNSVGGIIALKTTSDGAVIGTPFKQDNYLATFRQLELSGQSGERSIVFKTKIARKFPFPIIDGERFITENVVYDRYNNNYRFAVSNRRLTTCEYQADGLSSSPKKLMVNNPGGYMLYYRNRIDMAYTLRERVGYILRYNFFLQLSNKNLTISRYKGRYEFWVKMMKPLNIVVKRYYNV